MKTKEEAIYIHFCMLLALEIDKYLIMGNDKTDIYASMLYSQCCLSILQLL